MLHIPSTRYIFVPSFYMPSFCLFVCVSDSVTCLICPCTNFDHRIIRFLQLEQSLCAVLRWGVICWGCRRSSAGDFLGHGPVLLFWSLEVILCWQFFRMEPQFTSEGCASMKQLLANSWKKDSPMPHRWYLIYRVHRIPRTIGTKIFCVTTISFDNNHVKI